MGETDNEQLNKHINKIISLVIRALKRMQKGTYEEWLERVALLPLGQGLSGKVV